MRSNQAAVLAGIRVLDFTSMIAGAYCTRLLADLGAEVGQHSREVICDLLGYSPQRLTELVQQGVLIAADE